MQIIQNIRTFFHFSGIGGGGGGGGFEVVQAPGYYH